jgi:hypothetical protein
MLWMALLMTTKMGALVKVPKVKEVGARDQSLSSLDLEVKKIKVKPKVMHLKTFHQLRLEIEF